MQRICRLDHKERTTNSRNMENRVWNQESRRRVKTKQNTETYPTGGAIGDRSSNLVKLIGADNVSLQNFKYEGTCYVTEDGELYDKEYVIAQKIQKTVS